jgi:hypothetical protein
MPVIWKCRRWRTALLYADWLAMWQPDEQGGERGGAHLGCAFIDRICQNSMLDVRPKLRKFGTASSFCTGHRPRPRPMHIAGIMHRTGAKAAPAAPPIARRKSRWRRGWRGGKTASSRCKVHGVGGTPERQKGISVELSIARPKSPSFIVPSAIKKMFSGLMSLWMMDSVVRLSRTRSSGTITSTHTCASARRPPDFSMSLNKSPPSQLSSTRYTSLMSSNFAMSWHTNGQSFTRVWMSISRTSLWCCLGVILTLW